MPFIVRGLAEAEKILRAFPGQLENNTIRRGMRRGAKVIQAGAQGRVRKKSGKTAKSIKVTTGVRKGMITAKIQLRGEHSYIGWFLEFGVVPHWISVSAEFRNASKAGTGGGSLKIGEKFVGDRVLHPGLPEGPFSFMRPTIDQEGDRAWQTAADYIVADIAARGFQRPDNEAEDE